MDTNAQLRRDLEIVIKAARDGAGEQLQRSHSDAVISATDRIFDAANRVETFAASLTH